MYAGFKIKKYFKDWKNILTFLFLLILIIAGIFLRIRNLGYLAFWGDDGHTYIGTVSILKHGYPLLPSGNILWHGILNYYLNVIPVVLFGEGEFAFRINSVFFGVLTIVLIYFVGKDIANKYTGFLAAFLLTFSSWYIHFSREARYYATLQFFFLLSFYLFYKGFIRGNKKFIVPATIFMCLTPLIHGIGFLLILLFIILLFYHGKKFFRLHVLIPFAVIFTFYLLQIINQIFFWKVGVSFYPADNNLRSILSAYLKFPDPFYFKMLKSMFPEMYVIFLAGIPVLILFTIFVSARHTFNCPSLNLNESEIKLKKLLIPVNIFSLYFIFFFGVLMVSMGQMYNQPRYIYFLMPFFLLIFSYILYLVSASLSRFVYMMLQKLKFIKINKKVSVIILIVIFIAISFFASSGININEALNIPEIKHSDKLNAIYSVSTSMTYHWDPAAAGKYVRENALEDDIIITTDIYNSYPYTGKVNYWLWTGDLISWSPYHREGNEVIDDTHGVRVLRNLTELIYLFETYKNKNIWLITSPSLFKPEHIDHGIVELLDEQEENLVLTARDNVSRLYYFPENGFRPSIKSFIPPVDVNIINPIPAGGIVEIDFTDPLNSDYLIYGMSRIEEGVGCWGIDDASIFYLSPEKNKNYVLVITARPFLRPDMKQTMEIILDNKKIGNIEFPYSETFNQYFIEFSADPPEDGISILEFKYGYSISPVKLGSPADSRNLSVFFNKLAIKETGY